MCFCIKSSKNRMKIGAKIVSRKGASDENFGAKKRKSA